MYVCSMTNIPPVDSNDCAFTALNMSARALEPERIVAIVISFLEASSYLDLVGLYGVTQAAVYDAVWSLVDAVNLCSTVGPFGFPKTEEECQKFADEWKASCVLHRVL